MLTAHDIATEPKYYNQVVKIGRHEWECMGYSRTGNTVRFARLIETEDKELRQINLYVSPEQTVTLTKGV